MSDDPRWASKKDLIRSAQRWDATPTGWQLLMLVKDQGERMLHEMKYGVHEKYLDEKRFYIELLELAERDAICAPILIEHVQRVLDEESNLYRLYRARQQG